MPLYAGPDSRQSLPNGEFCRLCILQTGSGRLFATAICTATHADCYRLVTSDFLFGMQGS